MGENIVYFPRYLKKIVNVEKEKNENKIIDIHLESSVNRYESTSGLLDNIGMEFYECFGEFKGKLRQEICFTKYKNIRLHYDDYRKIIEEDPKIINELNSLLYYYDVYSKKKENVYEYKNLITEFIRKYEKESLSREYIWNQLMENKKIKKNYDKIDNETIKKQLKKYILDYYEKNIKECSNFVMTNDRVGITMCILDFGVGVMDIYLLSRVFKKLDTTQTFSPIKQEYENRIIIVAGDFHINNYKFFLTNYLNYFTLYSKNSKIRCINISDLPQPFFDNNAISDLLSKNITIRNEYLKIKTPIEKETFIKKYENLNINYLNINNDIGTLSGYLDNLNKIYVAGSIDYAEIRKLNENSIEEIREYFDKNREKLEEFKGLNLLGKSFLNELIENNLNNIFDELLHEDIDVNLSNNDRNSPLHYAIYYDKNTLVNKLLDKKNININIKNQDNNTPLNLAIIKKNYEIVNILLDKKANIDIENTEKKSSLYLAIENFDDSNLDLIKKLISEKTINLVAKDNDTPLSLAMYSNKDGKKTNIIKTLIDSKANINYVNPIRGSMLNLAIVSENTELVDYLLERKADVNLKSGEERLTPLQMAAIMDNNEIIDRLIKMGADINQHDSNPLVQAIENYEIVEKLLGLNINVKNTSNGEDPFTEAINKGNPEIVRILLEKNVDINKKNNEGEIPIIKAIENKDVEIIKLLLENKADVNKTNKEGETPLISAIFDNNEDMVKLLLENGANVNKANNEKITPLDAAAYEKNVNIVKMLLENDAKIEPIRKNNLNVFNYLANNFDFTQSSYKKINKIKNLLINTLIKKGENIDKYLNKNNEKTYFWNEKEDLDKKIDILSGIVSLHVLYNGEKIIYLIGDMHRKSSNLDCMSGGGNKYFHKYKKYKNKYLLEKNNSMYKNYLENK